MKKIILIERFDVVEVAVVILLIAVQNSVTGQNEIIGPASNFTYTSFQPQLIRCQASHPPLKPISLQDLQSIVIQALGLGVTLKPLGSRHSGTDIICTDGVPISMRRINHFRYESATGQVTVGAGMMLMDFLEELHSNGRTITGLPTSGSITIGGALGGGTHGTGRVSPNSEPGTIADQVISLTLVDGRGAVRSISEPEVLRAFKANFGLLGIVYEVVIATIPQFKLQIRHFPQSDDILREENSTTIMSYLETSSRFQFWWYPTAKQVILSVGTQVSISTAGNCETHFLTEAPRGNAKGLADALETMQEGTDHLGMFAIQAISKLSLYQYVPGRSAIFSEPNNEKVMCSIQPYPIGFSHRMDTNICQVCSWEHGNDSLLTMEFAVGIPLHEFSSAVKTIQDIFEEYPVEFPLLGIFFRFLSSSDGMMIVNGGRDTVIFEWVLAPRRDRYRNPMMGTAASQAMIQALIEKHDGRPHWSKNGLYFSHQEMVEKAYPELPAFLHLMEKFDPHEIFLNDFGRRLKYGEIKTPIDGLVEHCALVDNCICDSDNDCGEVGRRGSLMCGSIQGYNVCRERPSDAKSDYVAFKGKVVRNFLSFIKADLT